MRNRDTHDTALRICALAAQGVITLTEDERLALSMLAGGLAAGVSVASRERKMAMTVIDTHRDVRPRFLMIAADGGVIHPESNWRVRDTNTRQTVASFSSHLDGNECLTSDYPSLVGRRFQTRNDAIRAINDLFRADQ